MRESHFFLRSVLRLFLCLLIAFSIILPSTSIESNASETTESTYSVNYNHAESYINVGNTYLSDSYLYDFELNSSDNLQGAEDSYIWYLGKMMSIFTTSPDIYGYRVVMERTNKTSIVTQACVASRWLCGSVNDLYNGSNVGNYNDVEVERVAFWVSSQYSVEQIRIAPLFRFYYQGTYNSLGSYSINADYKFTIIGYKTRSEYVSAMDSIQTELETQTEEMQQQTEEMQQQTEELKEQTNTQKGMLSKMTEFFGSFFDNLIDSVIGLFVPSSDELASIFQRFDDFFSEKFGFLYYPIDVLTDFVALITTEVSEAKITLPGFSIMGYEVWTPQTYNVGRVTLIQDICEYVKVGTGVIIVFAFLNYADKKFDLITRG